MLLGVVADDFTGASDIANTLARGLPGEGGLRTAQFLGVPRMESPKDIEAGVIALKSRSIPPADAVVQSLAALRWLQAQGARQFVFKYCSTFDSTPSGNIGPVGEALADALAVKGVVACPAFPTMGRTVYQGHLFVGDRPLNESGLEHHPLNPMTDANIRRWLRFQTRHDVGLVAWPTVARGEAAIAAALTQAAQRGETLVVVDAIADDDLKAIGMAVRNTKLVTGGSGIALGLPRNFIVQGEARGSDPDTPAIQGPEAILVGSCSRATRQQIEVHEKDHPTFRIDIAALMDDRFDKDHLLNFFRGNEGRAPLVYSSGDSSEVENVQKAFGREAVSEKLDRFFADTARVLVKHGVRRLVVAGGETSGAVVSALDLGALTVGPEIDPGVPVLVSQGDRPIALALKSGNFGAPDFFAKALRTLENRHDGK